MVHIAVTVLSVNIREEASVEVITADKNVLFSTLCTEVISNRVARMGATSDVTRSTPGMVMLLDAH